MAAQNGDILYLERSGIPGTATVAELLALADEGSFLPTPDLVDDGDETSFYFGWEDVSGGWLVRRQLRSDGSRQDATTGHAALASAWPNRATLTYS